VTAPHRVTVVLTHPIQYFAPWFRYITEHCPSLELTVLYAGSPTPAQQGTGFDVPFTWDRDLLEGYCHEFLDGAVRRVDSASILGVDARGVERAIAATRPDVVLVNGWHSAVQIRALLASRRLSVPVLYRGDSTLDSPGHALLRPLRRWRTRRLLGLFSAFLAVGRRSHEYLVAHGAVDPLIFQSPHAVDNEFFAAAAEEATGDARVTGRAAFGVTQQDFLLLFAGKVIARKRPLDAVRAAARLGPNVVVMFAGSGALENECRAEAARLGVRTVWRGVLGQAEMARTYALADCLVLPSDATETWGLVVNEAMACGVPCVVSDAVGCAADLVVPGGTGDTFALGDLDGLVAALDRVRLARESGSMGAACRARVADYSYRTATDGLVKACRRLSARRSIADNPGRPRVLALCGSMVIMSGVERMSLEILTALRNHGAAVHCIVNTWESSRIVDRADAMGASWSTGYYRFALTRRFNPTRLVQAAYDVAMTSAGMLRDVWRFRPTHIFVPEFTTALRNVPALLLLRPFGIRVVMRHGSAPEQGPFYRVMWRVLDALVDLHVANSEFTRGEVLAHRIAPGKCLAILNTAPTREGGGAPADASTEGRIIYVGQVIPPKGLHLLLDAVAILVGKGLDVTLDIVGSMDTWEPPSYAGYRERIRKRAAAPDLAGRVRFLGEREDVPQLLAVAAVHCCPSLPEIREGFGIVIVEAKEAAVPSVVFPSGALPEIVTHLADGWVCAEASVEALVEGLGHFLERPDARRRAGERARASVAQRFNQRRFVAEWMSVFGIVPTAGEPQPSHCVPAGSAAS
jgi:glycosyltransferase involved in cell wall biosynthesis